LSRRFGKTPSDSALTSGFEDNLLFQGSIDQEQIIRLQLNRCNVIGSTGDEALFGSAVNILLNNIPPQKRIEIEDMDEDYKEPYEELVFDKINKWKIGTVEHPVMVNGRLSPRIEQRVSVDYYKLLALINLKLAEAGLGIPMQRQEIVTGEQWDPNEENDLEEENTDDSDGATPDTEATG
jgi:hypothetical protein